LSKEWCVHEEFLFVSYSNWKHRPSLCHLDRSAA
jgi:hypothetical protein